MARAVIFLDRDGTLNVDKGYVHRAEEWEFTDRAPEALRALRAAGYAIALVTNQSGVGRGCFTLDDVRALHEYVQQRLAEDGVSLDAIAVCPHAPDEGCSCRKPRTSTDSVLSGSTPVALGSVTDPSKTIVITESATRMVPWRAPRDRHR
jgi:D,D-heptose 1,7-bisphosphate phosphatase